MELRPFGRTGLQVGPIALGAMNFGGGTDAATPEKMLLTALDSGVPGHRLGVCAAGPGTEGHS